MTQSLFTQAQALGLARVTSLPQCRHRISYLPLYLAKCIQGTSNASAHVFLKDDVYDDRTSFQSQNSDFAAQRPDSCRQVHNNIFLEVINIVKNG